MTHPYPPFSGKKETRCRKCCGMMGCQYQSAGWQFNPELDPQRKDALRFTGNGPEWMLRICVDCGYRWPEMCVDADKP
jgi:hypothetical protein